MTPEETQALSRRVAEALDADEAWEPAERCPQGHDNSDPECGGYKNAVGKACTSCEIDDDMARFDANLPEPKDSEEWVRWHEERAAAHPEWRIPRGEPKPYAEDANLMLAVIAPWAKARGLYLRLEGDGGWCAQVREPGADGDWTGNFGSTAASALARVFLAAVERWGR